ncbi:NTP transferase domain-containing protein [Schinkia sp. CFF1]
MTNKQNIIGIYLAAGKSSRMGRNKLLMPFGNDLLGIYPLQAAVQSNLDCIIVVINDDMTNDAPKDTTQTIIGRLSNFSNKITVVQCPDSKKGLSYSLNFGITATQAMNPDGVIVLLADQPFIHKNMLNQLIDIFAKEKVDYVASSFQEIIRPPILIGKRFFSLIKRLRGDEGAKKLLVEHPHLQGKIIHYEDEMLFYDIDTPEDYKFLLRQKGGKPLEYYWERSTP